MTTGEWAGFLYQRPGVVSLCEARSPALARGRQGQSMGRPLCCSAQAPHLLSSCLPTECGIRSGTLLKYHCKKNKSRYRIFQIAGIYSRKSYMFVVHLHNYDVTDSG